MKIDDINENYIRQRYHLNDYRKKLKQQVNHNVNGIYIELFPESEMCIETFIGELNKYVDDIKAAYPKRQIEVNIRHSHEWEYSELDLIAYELYDETDKQIIKRLISNERSKLQRKKTKQTTKDATRERELKTLRKLMTKYKKEV